MWKWKEGGMGAPAGAAAVQRVHLNPREGTLLLSAVGECPYVRRESTAPP